VQAGRRGTDSMPRRPGYCSGCFLSQASSPDRAARGGSQNRATWSIEHGAAARAGQALDRRAVSAALPKRAVLRRRDPGQESSEEEAGLGAGADARESYLMTNAAARARGAVYRRRTSPMRRHIRRSASPMLDLDLVKGRIESPPSCAPGASTVGVRSSLAIGSSVAANRSGLGLRGRAMMRRHIGWFSSSRFARRTKKRERRSGPPAPRRAAISS